MTPTAIPVPATKFVILTFSFVCNPYDFTFTCTTDQFSHLTAHVGLTPPVVRLIPFRKRGAPFLVSSVTCFVPLADIEQQEPGDTLTHTFIIPLRGYCSQHYFYLTGTRGGKPMTSVSQFFHVHCPKPTEPVETNDSCKTPVLNTGYCQYWNAGSQTFQPDHNYTLRKIALRLNQFDATRGGPFIVKVTTVGGSCWLEPILWSETRSSLTLPMKPSQNWTYYTGLNVPLTAFVTYRIVIHTLPGWFPSETSAAILHWLSTNSACYPRGNRWYNCNFRDRRGPWLASSYDLNFILYQEP